MSDDEGTTKKSGYRLEYASSARAKCKGPKPCSGNAIGKGELRLGSIVDFRGKTSFVWRHWGCTTTKIISNMKSQFESADELDGFDELNDEDKERIRRAWEDGKVADEEIPETAKKPAGEEGNDGQEKPKKRAPAKPKKDAGEKPKRKRAPPKAKEVEGDEDDEAVDKPNKAPARKPRAKKITASSDISDKAELEEKPKKRAPARKPAGEKKALAKKRAAQKDEEDSGEDFAEAIADVQDDERESTEEGNKKRKRPATSKPASAKKTKVTSRAKKSKSEEVVEDEEEEDYE